jgi:FkbM family methyltransferase
MHFNIDKNLHVIDLNNIKITTINTGYCNNIQIICGDKTSEFAKFSEDSLEFKTYRILLDYINPNVCLDVGSNIGIHALFFSQFCKQVYCFEPNPYIYPILKNNITIDRTNIQAFPFGLSLSSADLNLQIDLDWNTGHSGFVSENAPKHMKIVPAKVEVGDEIISQNGISHIDFIKIDTEGFEANVLMGLKQCILKYKPLVSLEWNTDSTRNNFNRYNLFKELFPEYAYFGIGSSWHRFLYPSIFGKIKRGILKNILKVKKSEILQEFVFSKCYDYENVFFIPHRYIKILKYLSFYPKGYIPQIGSIRYID